MVHKRFITWSPALALFLASPIFADSINPSTFAASLSVGESTSLTKTVTVTERGTSPVDVFFLMDTTGSMGGSLSDITSNFGSIVASISALNSNVAFGVGNYNDCRNGPGDCPAGTLDLAYTQNLDLSLNPTDVQAALGSLRPSGGGDGPESNIYGLQQAATTTSWRSDSNRFLFWAGDINGHDPRQGVTEADAAAALVANGVKTYALSVGFGGLDSTGQATRITTATGGDVLSGGYSEISALIEDSLTTALLNYLEVTLDVVGLSGGVDVSWVPTDYTGSYDRSINRDFPFELTFTGITPGKYDFEVVARVDGNIVARESDSITVLDEMGGPPSSEVPEPSTSIMVSGAILLLAGLSRRRFQGKQR